MVLLNLNVSPHISEQSIQQHPIMFLPPPKIAHGKIPQPRPINVEMLRRYEPPSLLSLVAD
jgi:hypothetical protein